MSPFKDFKPEIKTFLIVVLVAVVVVVGGILLLQQVGLGPSSPAPSSSLPSDLALCSTNDECVVVPYSDCCASKKAINKKYEEVYLNNPEWQRPSEETLKLCTVIECPDEAQGVTSASCVQNTCVLDRNKVDNQQSTIDTSNWQIYRNTEFGFEFEYPNAGWEINVVYPGQKTIAGPDEEENLIIDIISMEESETIENIMFSRLACPGDFCERIGSPPANFNFSSRATLGEHSFYFTSISSYQSAGPHIIYYYLPDPRNNRVIAFRLTLAKGYGATAYYEYGLEEEPSYNTLNQILSIFRFVDYSQIQTLEIIPSEKSNEGVIYYQEGAKAIAMGMNLSKVEFRQRGGGQIYTSPEGGLIGVGTMADVKSGEQKWEVLLPSERTMLTLCGVGFDSTGGKVGEVCLHNILPAGL